MKIKKSFAELKEFNQVANYYLHPDNKKDTKLTYALEKVLKRLNKHFTKFNEELDDLNRKYQATDEDGILLYHENGSRKYKKDDDQKRVEEQRKLSAVWDKKEFEFVPFEFDTFPNVEETHIEALEGFVLKQRKKETV